MIPDYLQRRKKEIKKKPNSYRSPYDFADVPVFLSDHEAEKWLMEKEQSIDESAAVMMIAVSRESPILHDEK